MKGTGGIQPSQTLWTRFSPVRASRPVGTHLQQSCGDIYQCVASQGKHCGSVALAEVKAELSFDSWVWALLI